MCSTAEPADALARVGGQGLWSRVQGVDRASGQRERAGWGDAGADIHINVYEYLHSYLCSDLYPSSYTYRLNIVLLHVVHLCEHMLPNPVSGQGSEFNICDMYMPKPQHMCRASIRRCIHNIRTWIFDIHMIYVCIRTHTAFVHVDMDICRQERAGRLGTYVQYVLYIHTCIMRM